MNDYIQIATRGRELGLISVSPNIDRRSSSPMPLPPLKTPDQCSAVAASVVAVKIGDQSFMLDVPAARSLRRQLDCVLMTPTRDSRVAVFEVLHARFGLTEAQICQHTRVHPIALIRQVGFWLMRHAVGMTLKPIGRSFNGFDHGTVIHGINAISKRMEKDAEFRADVEILKQNVQSMILSVK